jgi:hypothetical protein
MQQYKVVREQFHTSLAHDNEQHATEMLFQVLQKLRRPHANQMRTFNALQWERRSYADANKECFSFSKTTKSCGWPSAVSHIFRGQGESCWCWLKYDTLGLILGSSVTVVTTSSTMSSIGGPGAIFPVVAGACPPLVSHIHGPATTALVALPS